MTARFILQDAIDALGCTPDRIAANLLLDGCYGRRRNPFSCPVATYLKKQGFRATVTQFDISAGSDYIMTPSHVRQFIVKFDEYEYPELIK